MTDSPSVQPATPTIHKVEIKEDGELERLILSAKAMGYSEALADLTDPDILGHMSRQWPHAAIFLSEKIRALSKKVPL